MTALLKQLRGALSEASAVLDEIHGLASETAFGRLRKTQLELSAADAAIDQALRLVQGWQTEKES